MECDFCKKAANCFTVNGEAPEFTETEIDGVIYYHISVDLPAKDTLSDILLKVDLISEETTVRAKWTLNVLSYAKKVLDDSTTDAVNEKLIKSDRR